MTVAPRCEFLSALVAVNNGLIRINRPAFFATNAEGLGQTRPVRTNLTRGGRAAIRRVEFHIVNPNAR